MIVAVMQEQLANALWRLKLTIVARKGYDSTPCRPETNADMCRQSDRQEERSLPYYRGGSPMLRLWSALRCGLSSVDLGPVARLDDRG